ncbi:MAG: transglutaminase-like domain-containing protein [Clostridia bacterium]|nr:transglutaminase-like domain-containing protein [Clostridia bacterium]
MDNLRERVLAHCRETGPYTCAGLYADAFRALPDELPELGRLVCGQIIHRVTLREGNANANRDRIYGDMERFPWQRMRCEDDLFLTAPAMAAELFRLDGRGFVADRAVEHKLVLTCRYVSVLMSAILKAKGIPCRSRAGFAPYFQEGQSWDHWINQAWIDGRWITFDADGFYEECGMPLRQYDMPETAFDWAAQTWLDIRRGRTDGARFIYADGLGTCGLEAAIRGVFYDFHALMNDEISYRFQPCWVDGRFDRLTEDDLRRIDGLAETMLDPDGNFDELKRIWETERRFRVMNSPLVGEWDNLPLMNW